MTDVQTASDDRLVGRLRVIGWSMVAFLLLLPAVAMRFTNEVNWTVGDFLFAALLMGVTGLVLELVVRHTRNWSYRLGIGAAIAASFLLVWINGAVGIIGDEDNPANLLFFGVIAVALVGAVLARFRPQGTAMAMFAAAAAQAAVGIAAVIGALGSGPSWPTDVIVSTIVFCLIWAAAGMLFRRAPSTMA
jgi:hypothetical protein